MGKVGRIACIATPGVLTVASLVCLILVFVAGMNKSDATLSNLYFVQLNTTNFRNQVFVGVNALEASLVNNNFLAALNSAVKNGKIQDIYKIYLTNYCSGSNNGTLTYCSPGSKDFYFNPIEIWGLNTTDSSSYVPKSLTDGLAVYQKVAVWQFIAYSVALWATVASIVSGFIAICSRWGSFLTSLVISVATLFTILSAVTSTVLFSSLTAAAVAALKPYGITLSMGTNMLALDWIAVAFSLGAWIFWVASICCCSGKSSHPHSRRNKGGNNKGYGHYDNEMAGGIQPGFHGLPFGQTRGYQPLEGGHGQQNGVELNKYPQTGAFKGRETAYEPFRPH